MKCQHASLFNTPPTSKPLGPLGSSSSQHRRTPELVLQKSHASFRITFRPPSAEDHGRNRLKGDPQPGIWHLLAFVDFVRNRNARRRIEASLEIRGHELGPLG